MCCHCGSISLYFYCSRCRMLHRNMWHIDSVWRDCFPTQCLKKTDSCIAAGFSFNTLYKSSISAFFGRMSCWDALVSHVYYCITFSFSPQTSAYVVCAPRGRGLRVISLVSVMPFTAVCHISATNREMSESDQICYSCFSDMLDLDKKKKKFKIICG